MTHFTEIVNILNRFDWIRIEENIDTPPTSIPPKNDVFKAELNFFFDLCARYRARATIKLLKMKTFNCFFSHDIWTKFLFTFDRNSRLCACFRIRSKLLSNMRKTLNDKTSYHKTQRAVWRKSLGALHTPSVKCASVHCGVVMNKLWWINFGILPFDHARIQGRILRALKSLDSTHRCRPTIACANTLACSPRTREDFVHE